MVKTQNDIMNKIRMLKQLMKENPENEYLQLRAKTEINILWWVLE